MDDRPRQEVPAQIVSDLLGAIRKQFYGDVPYKRWCQDAPFLKERFVTWPAAWLTRRGVTLPPERYKAILFDILKTVMGRGNTGVVKYWPGYLAHCVQEHFRIHSEDYYDEGKAIRTSVERAMLAFRHLGDAQKPDPIESLAQVHAILVVARKCRPRRRSMSTKEQPLLKHSILFSDGHPTP